MHQLERISKWRRKWFSSDSMPCINTIKAWIDKGKIDGEVIAGNYYVYVDVTSPLGKKPSKHAEHLVNMYQKMQVNQNE